MAVLRGRERAVPQDVYDVAYDILNARLALSYRALAEGFTIDDVLVDLLTTVPAPGSAAWPPPVPAVPPTSPPSAWPQPPQSSWPQATQPTQPAWPQPTQARVTVVGTPSGVPALTPPIVLPGDPSAPS